MHCVVVYTTIVLIHGTVCRSIGYRDNVDTNAPDGVRRDLRYGKIEKLTGVKTLNSNQRRTICGR